CGVGIVFAPAKFRRAYNRTTMYVKEVTVDSRHKEASPQDGDLQDGDGFL
ncbi:hypothetical protein MKW98_023526, partial [Papaver atlanticum]